MTALTEAAVMTLALACAPDLDPMMITGIARQESGLDPARVSAPNVNGSRDIGLMQINERNFGWLHLTMQTALDPCQSIRAAAQLLLSYSRYNTGSPTAGFGNGYVPSVVAAVAQTKAGAAAPIQQQPTLSEQITPFTSEESR
jgi:type IV secretion system protein VirB1